MTSRTSDTDAVPSSKPCHCPLTAGLSSRLSLSPDPRVPVYTMDAKVTRCQGAKPTPQDTRDSDPGSVCRIPIADRLPSSSSIPIREKTPPSDCKVQQWKRKETRHCFLSSRALNLTPKALNHEVKNDSAQKGQVKCPNQVEKLTLSETPDVLLPNDEPETNLESVENGWVTRSNHSAELPQPPAPEGLLLCSQAQLHRSNDDRAARLSTLMTSQELLRRSPDQTRRSCYASQNCSVSSDTEPPNSISSVEEQGSKNRSKLTGHFTTSDSEEAVSDDHIRNFVDSIVDCLDTGASSQTSSPGKCDTSSQKEESRSITIHDENNECTPHKTELPVCDILDPCPEEDLFRTPSNCVQPGAHEGSPSASSDDSEEFCDQDNASSTGSPGSSLPSRRIGDENPLMFFCTLKVRIKGLLKEPISLGETLFIV